MRISEYKDGEALDLLADIIEPLGEILGDEEIRKGLSAGEGKMKLVSLAIKKHKKALIQICWVLDGQPENYHINVFTLPVKVFEILSDKELLDFFTLQATNIGEMFSGNAMETTEGGED